MDTGVMSTDVRCIYALLWNFTYYATLLLTDYRSTLFDLTCPYL